MILFLLGLMAAALALIGAAAAINHWRLDALQSELDRLSERLPYEPGEAIAFLAWVDGDGIVDEALRSKEPDLA